MRAKINRRPRGQQDKRGSATQFTVVITEEQQTAPIKAPTPEQIRALAIAGSPEPQAAGIADLRVVAGGDTKHGTGRRWGKSQWTQAALIDLLGTNLPHSVERVNIVQLTKEVNVWLTGRWPYYQLGPVTRWTVKSALEQHLDANASPRRVKRRAKQKPKRRMKS